MAEQPEGSRPSENSQKETVQNPSRRRFLKGTAALAGLGVAAAAGEKTSEYEADTLMFNSIVDAWDKYQKTGDSSGYPFVFVTPEGIIITKKSPTPQDGQQYA